MTKDTSPSIDEEIKTLTARSFALNSKQKISISKNLSGLTKTQKENLLALLQKSDAAQVNIFVEAIEKDPNFIGKIKGSVSASQAEYIRSQEAISQANESPDDQLEKDLNF